MNTTFTTTLENAAKVAVSKFFNNYGIKCDAEDLRQDLYIKVYETSLSTGKDYENLPFGVYVSFAKRILLDQTFKAARCRKNATTDECWNYLSETLLDEEYEAPKDWSDKETKVAYANLAPRSRAAINRIYGQYKDKYYNKPEIAEFFESVK